MNTTLCEAKVIAAIAFNDLNKANGRRPTNNDQTSGLIFLDDIGEQIGKSPSQVRGILKTLDRAGLADVTAESSEDDLHAMLTNKGFTEFALEFCPNAASLTVALEEIDAYFADKPKNHQKVETKTLPWCDEAGFPSRAAVENAEMPELLAFYNANVPENKMLKKFSNRADAVKKVLTLLAALSSMVGEPESSTKDDAVVKAKSEGVKVHKTRKSTAKKAAKKEEVIDDENMTDEEWEARLRQDLENAGKENKEPATPKNKAASSNISRSWNDGEVKAARLTRNGVTVTVNGKCTEHKSTKAAFEAYSLPLSKHIRFRLRLKEEKECIFEHNDIQYLFQLV